MKEICVYKSKYQIWRLLISEENKLIIEERDTEKKEAYFSCINLPDVTEHFSEIQFDEKFWLGIEAIDNEIMYLHKFSKPDMPAHKGIIAYDLNSKKIIWQNNDYNFLFIADEIVYAFVQQFESKKFYRLNSQNGELIDEIELDQNQINVLKQQAYTPEKYASYIFPEPVNFETILPQHRDYIEELISEKEIVGTIELVKYNDLLMFNYYYKNNKGLLNNNFYVIDKNENKLILEKQLFTDANAFVPDSFFIKENYLIALKDRDSVLIYKL